jgi:hypothetical protein
MNPHHKQRGSAAPKWMVIQAEIIWRLCIKITALLFRCAQSINSLRHFP